MNRSLSSSIEALEPRIAPAVFATFPDVDGDLVTVTISKGTPPGPNGPGDAIIVLSPQGPLGGLGACQLLRINLSGNQVFKGANITVTATPQDLDGDGFLDGDGLVNVGFIDASGGGGIDLGAVFIDGDLGRIVAGDADLATPAVKSLTVRSLGLFGTNTGAANLTSDFTGKLGALTVKTDVAGATLLADGMGNITIGGSVRQSLISSDGAAGIVKVGGDWIGSDTTGSGDLSVRSLAGLSIGGSWIAGTSGGNIRVMEDSGPIKIGRDFVGNGRFLMMNGAPTGQISVTGKLASLTVGGSMDGSLFEGSVRIITNDDIGPVKIGGDFAGAGLSTTGKLASFTVGGKMTTFVSTTGDIGPVKIGGSLDGRIGTKTGRIASGGSIASVKIGGSMLGGAGSGGEISAGGKLGPVFIGGDVVGGSTSESGYIHTLNGGAIASVTILGSLRGEFSGTVDTGKVFSAGTIGAVKIGHDIVGGGRFSGMIDGLSIASVRVGGSVIGGGEDFSGVILSRTVLGPVTILGDLIGGRTISAAVSCTGYIEADRIVSIVIGGNIISGIDGGGAGITLDGSGSIRANDNLVSLTVKGSLVGNSTIDESNVIISARGQAGLSAAAKNDVAIGKISIGGSVTQAKILAGYSTVLGPKNADAQIGSIIVGGDIVSSSIIAGVTTSAAFFGTAADTKITGAGMKDNPDALGAVSKIASITIKGAAIGSIAPNDLATFGVVAQQLGAIKLGGGAAVKLKSGASNDLFLNDRRPLGPTQGANPVSESLDFHAFEV